ncbi:Hypothetical predicted protein, partial [Marmota monax]
MHTPENLMRTWTDIPTLLIICLILCIILTTLKLYSRLLTLVRMSTSPYDRLLNQPSTPHQEKPPLDPDLIIQS